MTEPDKKCPFCAELIKSEAIKCKHCGSFLSTGDKTSSGKPKKTEALIFMLLISVPFIIGGLLLAWYSTLPATERARLESVH